MLCIEEFRSPSSSRPVSTASLDGPHRETARASGAGARRDARSRYALTLWLPFGGRFNPSSFPKGRGACDEGRRGRKTRARRARQIPVAVGLQSEAPPKDFPVSPSPSSVLILLLLMRPMPSPPSIFLSPCPPPPPTAPFPASPLFSPLVSPLFSLLSLLLPPTLFSPQLPHLPRLPHHPPSKHSTRSRPLCSRLP